MAIIECTNPRAAGYDPNVSVNDPEIRAAHVDEAHVKSYEGRVLATYERNMYDDSDFCALVLDDEEHEIKSIQYATTRGWTYHNSAKIDADEETLVRAERVYASMIRQQISAEWLTVQTGKTVRSTTKRGKYVGVEGLILNIDEQSFRGRHTVRARVSVTNEDSVHCGRAVWLDVMRLEVVGEADKEAINEYVTHRARARDFRSLFTSNFRDIRFADASAYFFTVDEPRDPNEKMKSLDDRDPEDAIPGEKIERALPATATARTTHAQCSHENTKSARAKCRRDSKKSSE